MTLPSQQLLTNEMLVLTIKSQITFGYSRKDVVDFKLANFQQFMTNTCMGIMKQVVSERSLEDIQSNQTEFSKACSSMVQEKITNYGLEIFSIDITNIALP